MLRTACEFLRPAASSRHPIRMRHKARFLTISRVLVSSSTILFSNCQTATVSELASRFCVRSEYSRACRRRCDLRLTGSGKHGRNCAIRQATRLRRTRGQTQRDQVEFPRDANPARSSRMQRLALLHVPNLDRAISSSPLENEYAEDVIELKSRLGVNLMAYTIQTALKET